MSALSIAGIAAEIAAEPGHKRPKLVADLFCGAGGTSKGAKSAFTELGLTMELVALNHWDVAVETHRRANPTARHYCQDIAAARPIVIVPEGYLDLLMASPTCTHHSRARGGRPTSDQQRTDPWHIITWCTELRVKRLLIENVPEYVEWGPVDRRTGKPVKSRKGEYFRAWIRTLEALGFKLEWHVANAADFGDATTRQRFMLSGRSDGKRLRSPVSTHSAEGPASLFALKRWRSARDIIDWRLKGRSIYGRPQPLKFKTLKRIESGLIKLGGDAASPYLPRLRAEIQRSIWYHALAPADRATYRTAFKAAATSGAAECTLSGETFLIVLRGTGDVRPVDLPIPAVTASGGRGGGHLAVVELAAPSSGVGVEPFILPQQGSGPARDIDRPVPTIVGAGRPMLVEAEPMILNRHGNNGGSRVHSVDHPLPTATTSGAGYLIEPFMLGQHGGSVARPVSEPLMTITGAGAISIVQPQAQPFVVNLKGRSDVRDIDEPLPTQTAHTRHLAVAEPFLVEVNHGDDDRRPRTIDDPLPTASTRRGVGLVEPFIAPYYGTGSGATGKSIDEPLDTITATARFGLIDPFVVSTRHSMEGAGPRPRSVDLPLPTITAGGSQPCVVEPLLMNIDQHGSTGPCVRSVDRPLATLVTKANMALIEPVDDGFDIRFRMIQNPEIARATGFDNDETSYEFAGTKAEVTKQIGNAVPVHMARAHVLALMRD